MFLTLLSAQKPDAHQIFMIFSILIFLIFLAIGLGWLITYLYNRYKKERETEERTQKSIMNTFLRMTPKEGDYGVGHFGEFNIRDGLRRK